VNVLVTGGAGFIGSHLATRLLSLGHRVIVIDNEATGRREDVPAGAELVRGDVSRIADLEPLFAGGLDAVLHVAGQVSLIRSFTDPVVDLRTNVEGTLNVLRLCLAHKVPRLLYASSMTVYGRDGALPTPEDTPCAPISYYGITKYAAERYVHMTAERSDLEFDLHVTSFRMYNVYGPRQALDNPYQGVLGIFLGNLLRDEPITIFGDGHQSRDFIYIDDVVDAWVGALDNAASYGQVINLGSGQQLSINALADYVLGAFGHSRDDWPVRHASARPGEQRQVEAEVARARAVLGWKPRVAFEAGLAETVRWARQTEMTGSRR
jgi:UDP-glucose 4-epimerase